MKNVINLFIEDSTLEEMGLNPEKYEHLSYSTVFVDFEDETFLGSVHENDGDWRDEYFNPIFEGLGIKIKAKNYSNLSDVEKESLKKMLSS